MPAAKRIAKKIFFGTVLLLIIFCLWFLYEFFCIPHKSPSEILFEISKGQTAKEVGQALKKRGIIRLRWPFLFGYKFFYSSHTLKAGEYLFRLPLSTKDIIEKLIEGRILLHTYTVPEGLTRKETAAHFETLGLCLEKDFLAASEDTSLITHLDPEADNLEGYLYPETYHFPKYTQPGMLVSAMIRQFQEIFTGEWKNKANDMNMSVREIVILASLIEKETSLTHEKKLVSSVFHNRLKRGIKLDCDPTIIYVLKENDRFTGRLRYKDLKMDDPYNTYIYGGLPPGPISNPGKESLEAALYPANTDYLYFVSRNDGSHKFSATLKEHNKAVRKYQK